MKTIHLTWKRNLASLATVAITAAPQWASAAQIRAAASAAGAPIFATGFLPSLPVPVPSIRPTSLVDVALPPPRIIPSLPIAFIARPQAAASAPAPAAANIGAGVADVSEAVSGVQKTIEGGSSGASAAAGFSLQDAITRTRGGTPTPGLNLASLPPAGLAQRPFARLGRASNANAGSRRVATVVVPGPKGEWRLTPVEAGATAVGAVLAAAAGLAGSQVLAALALLLTVPGAAILGGISGHYAQHKLRMPDAMVPGLILFLAGALGTIALFGYAMTLPAPYAALALVSASLVARAGEFLYRRATRQYPY